MYLRRTAISYDFPFGGLWHVRLAHPLMAISNHGQRHHFGPLERLSTSFVSALNDVLMIYNNGL